MINELSKSYYLTPIKFIRDLVHGYVTVTEFELKLIDTIHFQRLKDVRQLTCNQVFPSARHTRFEHSLGVLELTRQAIKNLNKNKIISFDTRDAFGSTKPVINENLQFNATLAALLHDVGHCPFSHLGEAEFDPRSVYAHLVQDVASDPILKGSRLVDDFRKNAPKDIGAVHEQLSCIIILEKYRNILSNLTCRQKDASDGCSLRVDFELIIRCILGIEYDTSSLRLEKNRIKNVLVRLINSKIFDMDKLDYIMRDAMFTGIGTPTIDTHRLFRNMHLTEQYELVFTSKAVPALQNMIESRDGLYMYVYNHQAVVLSDFMNSYILRRLSHNAYNFLKLIHPDKSHEDINEELEELSLVSLAMIPKPYLFSVYAVVEMHRSDSDWVSLLNIFNADSLQFSFIEKPDLLRYSLKAAIQSELFDEYSDEQIDTLLDTDDGQSLLHGLQRTYALIHHYKTRTFLKPWWKNLYGFTAFMKQNFRDIPIRKQLCQWIYAGGKCGLDASEFRSQLAKTVIFLTQKIPPEFGLIEPLHDDEFFIIERPTRFFDPKTIENLNIALKANEVLSTGDQTSDYIIKSLTDIIPQKDYTSIYAKESFYVFSKPLPETPISPEAVRKHYKLMEQIFSFVAVEFIRAGEVEFVRLFKGKKRKEQQEKFRINLLNKFLSYYNINRKG